MKDVWFNKIFVRKFIIKITVILLVNKLVIDLDVLIFKHKINIVNLMVNNVNNKI